MKAGRQHLRSWQPDKAISVSRDGATARDQLGTICMQLTAFLSAIDRSVECTESNLVRRQIGDLPEPGAKSSQS